MNDRDYLSQRTQDLLNGGIDGELSTTERDELDRLLASSENIRNINEELKVFTGLLDELPELDPPEYLQKSIERQVRLPVQGNQHQKKQGIFGAWSPTHWLSTGFALAAGVLLTVGVYQMGSGPITPEDVNSLAGTVVKSQASGQGELLDSVHIFTDTLSGRVELWNKEDLFSLNVQLESEGLTQLVVNFDGRGLAYEGITRMQDNKDVVSTTEGSVNIVSSGEKSYTLNLRRMVQGKDAASLELKFFANRLLVHEAELSVFQ